MEFSKLYKEWVMFLKNHKLYGRYILDCSKINAYFSSRTEYYENIRNEDNRRYMVFKPKFFISKKDFLINDKSRITYPELESYLKRLDFHIYHIYGESSKWAKVLRDFGRVKGYYEHPIDLFDFYSSESASSISTENAANTNVGHWYDIYYNRGRISQVRNRIANNAFINNVRWRR
jgi:hypothetical protein